MAMVLKDPRPASTDNGAPGGKPRPRAHTFFGHDKKPILHFDPGLITQDGSEVAITALYQLLSN